MYFTRKELEQSINAQDERIKNFFDTFGFVVIREMIPKKDFKMLLREYDKVYDKYEIFRNNGEEVKSSWYKLLNSLNLRGKKRFGIREALGSFRRVGMRFHPNFVDSSELYSKYFFANEFKTIYKYFAGENWLFLGSDGSNFVASGFPWHRDWFVKTPMMKFNFYYNPWPFFGGKFLLIPGSGIPDDAYSQMIQKCIAWPMMNKKPGGMSENDRLPATKNPRNIFGFRNKSNKLKNVPHIEIKLKKGDLILFDHRQIHTVQNCFPPFQRRLMTLLISKNAFDFSDNHYSLKNNTRESLMREVIDLVVSERNHIGTPPWGDYIGPIENTNNYIKIEKTSESKEYNLGSIETSKGFKFSSTMDMNFYAKCGKDYRKYIDSLGDKDVNRSRNEMEYSYGDIHLGVNSQNIDKKIDSN